MSSPPLDRGRMHDLSSANHDPWFAWGPLRPDRHPLALVALAFSMGILADHLLGRHLGSPGFWVLLATVAILPWGTRRILPAMARCGKWWALPLHAPMATQREFPLEPSTLGRSASWCPALPLATLPFAALLLGFAALGGAWHQLQWRWYPEDHLGLHAETTRHPICLEAKILSGPRYYPAHLDPWGPPRAASSLLHIRALRARDGQQWIPVSGTGKLRVQGTVTGLRGGDTVRVHGTWLRPDLPANPGDFPYAHHLRLQRELFLVRATHPACIELIQAAPWWTPRRILESLRGRGRATLAQFLPDQHAPLASALLLGARELLTDEDVLPFMLTGTVHLLAISGLHLGILVYAIWLSVRLGWISERTGIIVSLLLVIPYALVTECRPPVVRAALFVVVACGGRWLLRPLPAWNTLAAAALFLLIWNPLHLFQTGVHLSFLALIGLGTATTLALPSSTDPLDRLIESTRPRWERTVRRALKNIWRMVMASLIVWLLTLPLIASHFHVVSPAGVLMNPILWIPLAGALLSGFLLVLSGWILPTSWLSGLGIGPFLGAACSRCLGLTDGFIQAVAASPYSHFWTAAPPPWWTYGFYLLAGLTLFSPKMRPPRRLGLVPGTLWLGLGLFLVAGPPLLKPPPQLTCTFFAVGHGTCILIETPDGHSVLYDAGHLGPSQSVVRTVSHYLWATRRKKLDLIIISHADMDHFNAIPALAERFSAREVWVPPHVIHHRGPLILKLRDHLQQLGIPVRPVHLGLQLLAPHGLKLSVLHPPESMRIGSDNAQSLVLLVEFAGRRILLPGDLESPGLEMLLREPTDPQDLVMAPHHGSPRSQPSDFIAWSQPAHVVISNGSPLPPETAREFQQSGAILRETSREGAIRVVIRKDGEMSVTSWRTVTARQTWGGIVSSRVWVQNWGQAKAKSAVEQRQEKQ